jgi:hypothetical protein
MDIDLKINPQKSFQFVRLLTNIVVRETDINMEPQLKRIKESSKLMMPSPKELRNAAMRTNIEIQSNTTAHDRFIDIMI